MNGTYSSPAGQYGGLQLIVNYTVTYNEEGGAYIFYAEPYLKYPYAISKRAGDSNTISYITNVADNSGRTTYSNPSINSNTGGTTAMQYVNLPIRDTVHTDGTFVMKPSATFNFNGTYNGVPVGTIFAEGSNINISPPSILSATYSNILATEATVSLTTNYACDKWYYSLDNATWVQLSTSSGTNLKAKIQGLQSGISNRIYYKVHRADLGNIGTYDNTVTTQGNARLVSVTGVQIDGASPSVTFEVDVYDTSYSYQLNILRGENVLASQVAAPSFSALGKQSFSVDLTSVAQTILAGMSDAKSINATYELVTQINGVDSRSTLIGTISTTAANSAPSFPTSGVAASISDSTTIAFYNDSTDIELGLIKNVSKFTIGLAGATPTFKNGASLAYYYAEVSGVRRESQSKIIAYNTPINIDGSTAQITFGVVDTRGYEIKHTLNVPLHDFTPIYFADPKVSRENGYDDNIVGRLVANYSPITITQGDTTITNQVGNITGEYSIDNGTTWAAISPLVVGINSASASYTGVITSVDNANNVKLRLTISDSLSSATIEVVVPSGVPLIHTEPKKVIINGDLTINGTDGSTSTGMLVPSTVGVQEGYVPQRQSDGSIAWAAVSGGGGSETDDYTALVNKPQINGVTLIGNKTTEDLGLLSVSAYSATLPANAWIGEVAPYTNTITVNGISATSNGYTSLAPSVNATQYEEARVAQLLLTSHTANTIVMSAFGQKPTVDIPIIIEVIG